MDERGGPDEDDRGILDTVRRILSEDQSRGLDQPAKEARQPSRQLTGSGDEDDILELEPTMMVDSQTAPDAFRQVDPKRELVGEHAEQTARESLGSLRNVMREQRALLTHRGGRSIEDIIREEIRPLLRDWLDANLPPLVEQLVRSEITRIVEREGR